LLENQETMTRFRQEIIRVPIAKQRRLHLHQVIDRKKLDCTHVTERKGPPSPFPNPRTLKVF
jgi:hypothetical protein